jgi:hypothetical protein
MAHHFPPGPPMTLIDSHRLLPCLFFAWALVAAQAQAADLPTFATDKSYVKPSFAPGDEQFVRDYAKTMGVIFTPGMELPSCMWRTRTRTAGGFMDGFTDENKYMAMVRVPVEMANVALRNVHMHRNDYPRTAYLELMDKMTGYEGKREGWEAVLVLPPLKEPGNPVGPRFELASASFGGVAVRNVKFYQMPGLQTRVYLGPIDKVIAGTDVPRLSVVLQNIVPASDTTAPRVSVDASFGDLRADLAKAGAELDNMRVRDRAKQCAVLGSSCMDGECK